MVVGKLCRNFKKLSSHAWEKQMQKCSLALACVLLDFSILMQNLFSPLLPRECCHPLWVLPHQFIKTPPHRHAHGPIQCRQSLTEAFLPR